MSKAFCAKFTMILAETDLTCDMPAFYVDSWWGTTATTSIFITAAITDWLDGYLARKVYSFPSALNLKETYCLFYNKSTEPVQWLPDEIRLCIWCIFRSCS